MANSLAWEEIDDSHNFYVKQGPLLADILSNAATSIDRYLELGGYQVAGRAILQNPLEIIRMVEEAGLRGRGGGGFPTGHKWRLVAESESPERYLICNANAVQPGGLKERFLIRTSPHRVLESVLLAAHAVGATTAIISLPYHLEPETALLERALEEATSKGFAGQRSFGSARALHILICQSPSSYITGEETALIELLEGRAPQPRGKPPLPTSRGLFGKPTVVSNLETILHAYHIVKYGPNRFRELGSEYSPGTLIFSLTGDIQRPGLYELPLGTAVRELIFDHAQGTHSGSKIKAVLPGGVFSPAIADSSLNLKLDYDSVRDAGCNLGSGVVVVISEMVPALQLASLLATFFYEKSCGKCKPCKDGNWRTLQMLHRLIGPDNENKEIMNRHPQSFSQEVPSLMILNNPGGIRYTDHVEGLDKIRHLCEFYKYRGDCHHSTESANSIQRLLDLFPAEFEKNAGNLNGSLVAGASNGS
ncbi:MAG TPA: NADH-ubiquinone oxidoreductase-F iron-sulfur binding region domain-containing protein [Candidatus Angelobacter sp.]|nr:NADH-ubiquinone oxidoreductase-F iron-sulfur binding region domain-containing protein [Candidatus Angelobacter sp.]